MFDYKDIPDLKKTELDLADAQQDASVRLTHLLTVLIYQNEQVLRELNSIGYKLYKMQQDKNV